LKYTTPGCKCVENREAFFSVQTRGKRETEIQWTMLDCNVTLLHSICILHAPTYDKNERICAMWSKQQHKEDRWWYFIIYFLLMLNCRLFAVWNMRKYEYRDEYVFAKNRLFANICARISQMINGRTVSVSWGQKETCHNDQSLLVVLMRNTPNFLIAFERICVHEIASIDCLIWINCWQ
jgi:hypothetical protein